MRFYGPIAKVDAERRMVWGYASTEALDDQGETVTREALGAALDGYMRFANIREMHRNSAVGVAKETEIDDKGLYLGAKIVDDEAWRKVVEGVYNGFSIGGRVTARDPADRKVITGLTLTEISVVDRPANPEAVFDCWKAASVEMPDDGIGQRLERLLGELDWLRQFIADGLAVDRSGRNTGVPAESIAATASATLRKALEPEIALYAAGLAKLTDVVVPRLDALQRRVEDIASMPLPPLTVARGFALSKNDDAGRYDASPEDVVAALARMTDDERTLTLIKAARANPIMR